MKKKGRIVKVRVAINIDTDLEEKSIISKKFKKYSDSDIEKMMNAKLDIKMSKRKIYG